MRTRDESPIASPEYWHEGQVIPDLDEKHAETLIWAGVVEAI